MSDALPQRLRLAAGAMPATPTLPDPYPYETVEPHREGYVERAGVRTWYAQYGASGPWLVFSPIYQIANSHLLRGVVPWLSQHFRVAVMDLRGNGRSDRPRRQEDYSFDAYYLDLLAVLDTLQAERVAIIGISATAMAAIRLAAEQPQRVSHLVCAGGWVDMRMQAPEMRQAAEQALSKMRADWPGFLDGFFGRAFSEPHSTKAYEDAVVRNGGASEGPVVALGREGWLGTDVSDAARRVRCPTLVIHGDSDKIVPFAQAEAIAAAVPGARLLAVGGGGHLMNVRDPVPFCLAVRDFIGAAPARSTWVRGMARKPRALFVSSAIGLGHVQRDLAIAREMRRQRPDLEIAWFTVHPASTYLEREGEHVHPACGRLASESRHFERQAGEHDLQAFFALRTMDEVMARNFLVFCDLLREEHFDIVVGDEAWE
ncbi:MAG TPA: alpha/beta fold hydrolase, partial [Ramlibacter sp.]|nr:alpha/beta fold hydrolase [Ramlibacter sp.]